MEQPRAPAKKSSRDALPKTRNSPVRKSMSSRHCNHNRDLQKVSDLLSYALGRQPLAAITTILKALQLTAAARRPLQITELTEAIETTIPISRNSCNSNRDFRNSGFEFDIVELCDGLLKAEDDGTVRFCRKGLRCLVSSPEFQHQYGLRTGDEVFAAICVQHLRCSEKSTSLTPGSPRRPCMTQGRQSCGVSNYASNFWHKHYLELDPGRSQWIHSLLHDAIISSLPRGGRARMQCQRRCNHVLATGLQMAAVHNLVAIGRTYLEMGAEIQSCSHSTQTPLHAATATSNRNMIELLLECGADINAIAQDAPDALDCGRPNGTNDIPDPLLSSCAGHQNCHCWRCCTCTSGKAPLHLAAVNGSEDILQLFLESNANINVKTALDGNTALHLAAKLGNKRIVQHLIYFGADLQVKNAAGETACQLAIRKHHVGIAELLSPRDSVTDLVPSTRPTYVDPVFCEAQATDPVKKMKSLSLEDAPPQSSIQRNQIRQSAARVSPHSAGNSSARPGSTETSLESWILMEGPDNEMF